MVDETHAGFGVAKDTAALTRSTSFVFARRQRLVLADFARASLGKLAFLAVKQGVPYKGIDLTLRRARCVTEEQPSRTAAALRRLDAQESHATKPAGPHRWQGARPLERSSTYASHESSSMDDAGLPPQTEDECVEVGGSTLAALLLEPLHQP